MGWSVHKHSSPDRKLDLFDRRLGRLHGVVKRKEGSLQIDKAAENLRLAGLALVKAKLSLISEFPDRDPTGRQRQKLQEEAMRWSALSVEAIVEEYGTATPDTDQPQTPDLTI